MAKKVLKKKVQQKPGAGKHVAPVMESAREIWLAGLGAFSVAQQESGRILEQGTKLFEKLVAEGSRLESRARKDVEGAVSDIRDEVESRVEEVRSQADAVRRQAADNWDKLEKIFEDRVARVLGRLGIPTRDDVNALAGKVERLARQVAELDVRAPSAKAPAAARKKPARKVSRKAAPKKAK